MPVQRGGGRNLPAQRRGRGRKLPEKSGGRNLPAQRGGKKPPCGSLVLIFSYSEKMIQRRYLSPPPPRQGEAAVRATPLCTRVETRLSVTAPAPCWLAPTEETAYVPPVTLCLLQPRLGGFAHISLPAWMPVPGRRGERERGRGLGF